VPVSAIDLSSPYGRIAALLEARCGFAQAVQYDRLKAFLGDRPAWEQDMLADRLGHAAEPDPDWQTLIEAMLVHETYFYRHPDQLNVFTQEILPQLARRRETTGRPLQVWCAGCSTGEEAYTLAFLLRDARCPAQILATDLSAESIAIARAGVYRRRPGLNSFRALPAHAWRHFVPAAVEPECWTVAADIRRTVEFAVHNLMAPHPPGFSADLISCRNTFIYFGPSGMQQVEAMLIAAARPGTVLMLGPAERLRHTPVFQPMTSSNPQILHWPVGEAR
jgi:chemotaxis protein methyltransferase CheR